MIENLAVIRKKLEEAGKQNSKAKFYLRVLNEAEEVGNQIYIDQVIASINKWFIAERIHFWCPICKGRGLVVTNREVECRYFRCVCLIAMDHPNDIPGLSTVVHLELIEGR